MLHVGKRVHRKIIPAHIGLGFYVSREVRLPSKTPREEQAAEHERIRNVTLTNMNHQTVV